MELFELIDSRITGEYSYCEITQVVLKVEDEYWNYFNIYGFCQMFVIKRIEYT